LSYEVVGNGQLGTAAHRRAALVAMRSFVPFERLVSVARVGASRGALT
jgi:hypothetical protein